MLFLPLAMTSASSASVWLCTGAESSAGICMLWPAGVWPLPSAPWHRAQLDWNVAAARLGRAEGRGRDQKTAEREKFIARHGEPSVAFFRNRSKARIASWEPGVFRRQLANALAGRGEDHVAKRRHEGRHRGLAAPRR